MGLFWVVLAILGALVTFPNASAQDIRICTEAQVNEYYFGNRYDNEKCAWGNVLNGCAPGFYTIDEDSDTYAPCPPYYFCPEAFHCALPCSIGAYCPGEGVVNTVSGMCEPYEYNAEAIVFDDYTCGGANVDFYCPGGYYCETPVQMKICPEGSFCAQGVDSPQRCPGMSDCPEGSDAPGKQAGGVFVLGLVSFGLFLVFYWSKRLRNFFRERRELERLALERMDREAKGVPTRTFGQHVSRWKLMLGATSMTTLRRRASAVQDDVEMQSTTAMSMGTALEPKSLHTNFYFKDLSLTLKTGKCVLQGVSGVIRASRVTAVMGPSGAGKTTFLSVLSNKASYGTVGGTIRINGKEEPLSKFKKATGFVPQEDVMHRVLTVKEILRASAKLRLPASTDPLVRKKNVNGIIKMLGLREVRHSEIGDAEVRGISGGQRKRVNIAMELVADPMVLFLDEPTSGLDSTASFEVVRALRDIAGLGITVVTVLHQPSYQIFTLFNDVLLLGKGGTTVYLGPTKDALAYFEQLGFTCPEMVNPADFFLSLIAEDAESPRQYLINDTPVQGLAAAWTEYSRVWGLDEETALCDNCEFSVSVNPSSLTGTCRRCNTEAKIQRPETEYVERTTANFFQQLYVFTIRGFIQQTRAPLTVVSDLVLVFIAGLLLGLMYYKPELLDLQSMNLLTGLAVGMTTVQSSLRCFGDERVEYWREAASGINRGAYFLGKNIAELPRLFVVPAFYLSVFWMWTVPRATVNDYFTVLLVTVWATSGLGYFISVITRRQNAQVAGVITVLLFAVFGGTKPTLPEMQDMGPLAVGAYNISYARWMQEALFTQEVDRWPSVWWYDIGLALELYGYDIDNWTLCIGMLVVLGVVFRIMAFMGLVLTHRGKQQ